MPGESQSGCASCALLAARRRLSAAATERTPLHRRWELQRGSAPASPEAPSLICRPLPTSLEVGGACPGLQRTSRPTRPFASFLTLRPAKEIQPLFNGLEARITHPRPSGVKNETEQRLEQKEQKGMKTSSGKALGHPKSHCPPTLARHQRAAVLTAQRRHQGGEGERRA